MGGGGGEGGGGWSGAFLLQPGLVLGAYRLKVC